MVQNEINNMSFLTADNKSKMAKVRGPGWAPAGEGATLSSHFPAPGCTSSSSALSTLFFPLLPSQLPTVLPSPSSLSSPNSPPHLHVSPPTPTCPGPLFPPPLTILMNPPTLSQGLGMHHEGLSVGGRGVGERSWRSWGNPSCLCLQLGEAGGRRSGQPHAWNLPHGSQLIPSPPPIPENPHPWALHPELLVTILLLFLTSPLPTVPSLTLNFGEF